MKKILIAGLVMGAMLSAYADTIKLDWSTWAFDHNASCVAIDPDDDSTGILNNYDVLWQLILSESGVPAEPDLFADHYLGAGDSFLDERVLTKGSSGWNSALYEDDNNFSILEVGDKTTVDHYYVYQRIYELEPGTTAPVEGTWYYDSAVEDLRAKPTWNAGTAIYIYAFGDPDQETGVKPNQQIPQTQSIPEPATMSLLGLGALVLGLRRKLRK